MSSPEEIREPEEVREPEEIPEEEKELAERGLVREEEDAAAAEAAQIGGDAPVESDDPAQQPVIESGEGEAEGFELAERQLQDIASHGDQHRFPDSVAPPPEEESAAEYGEADQALSQEENQ